MSDAKGQHEPSMEEILASIRRIIAEDSDAPVTAEGTPPEAAKPASEPAVAVAAAATAPAAKEDDVLELTEVIEDPPANEAAPSQPEEPAMSTDSEMQEPHLVSAAPVERERLLSNTTAAASVAALSQLVVRPRDKSGELPLGAADRTLEDMVRELMRPLLKDWLDQNLPGLVERVVKDEVARLVREAQGS
jgi:cell pole-organizing protein PopZ